MAGLNISNANLLYIKYQNEVQETLNQEAASYRDPRQEKWTGLRIEGRIHTKRSAALGANEDGGDFRSAKKQTYVAYTVVRRFFDASIQLTGGIMAAAKKSPQVAKDAVESEVKGMLEGAMKYHNGMYFRDGTGTVATVKAAYAGGTPTSLVTDDSRMLWEGGEFDVYNAALTTKRATVTIDTNTEALNASGFAVSTTAANLPTDMVVGDKLVWKGNVNRTMTGLDQLINDSSSAFQGVSASAVNRYASMVLDNSGTNRPISAQLWRQLFAGITMKTGKKPKKLKVYATPWQMKEFEEIYEGELRYSPGDKVSGRETTAFQSALGKIDYSMETDAPRHTLFAADLSQITKATVKPLGWRLQGGQMFLRSDRSNVWTATMDEICELYIKARHTSGRINDLSDDATIAF